ncbi:MULTISPECIES: hypothetical protein [unclassified Synechocystis]|uniref:hypothetical protein n=1 Tax=unclassified Synechocystis TaxID=2640012 RepID=UPI000420B1E6|nr:MULTISPECIES: hypothetical protein [unclassified Synechocystis]AIE73235.1 hypothetical protein D082_07060 [Synechocystis sp. PCC 6714]
MVIKKGFYLTMAGLAVASVWPLSACAINPSSPQTEKQHQSIAGDRREMQLAQNLDTYIFETFDPNGDEPKLNGKVEKGDVSASISYRQEKNDGYESWFPTVTVKFKNKTVATLEGTESPMPIALIQITDMDPSNPYPAVLFATYTGGAHCCNAVQVVTGNQDGSQWSVQEFGFFNGGPHPAEDLNNDNLDEYVEVDNSFLYRFSSYAGSAAPAQIWQLKNNQIVNSTFEPEFQFIHQENARSMAKELPEIMAQDSERNGFLAAYVANKALIGELDEGWQTMLKYYDKNSDWGLTDCQKYDDQSNCLREVQYNSYPDALRAFLVETGYIRN